jgi:periplasmic copper chaperone A
MKRTTATTLASAAFSLTLLASLSPAAAHVTVSAPGAVRGGSDTVITFRVPTESDTASTTGLRVRLPTSTPLLGVLVRPVPGWTVKVIQAKLAHSVSTDDGPVTQAVSEIDWTATGGGTRPDGFQEFAVIVGQLPKTPTLTFKAIQHYSDNTDVSWVEVAGPGAAEPEHPAPTLDLAAPSGPTVTTTATAPTTAAATMSMSSPASTGPSGTGTTVAIALAGVGILLGGFALWIAHSSRRAGPA